VVVRVDAEAFDAGGAKRRRPGLAAES
jgi:hypothetical protein